MPPGGAADGYLSQRGAGARVEHGHPPTDDENPRGLPIDGDRVGRPWGRDPSQHTPAPHIQHVNAVGIGVDDEYPPAPPIDRHGVWGRQAARRLQPPGPLDGLHDTSPDGIEHAHPFVRRGLAEDEGPAGRRVDSHRHRRGPDGDAPSAAGAISVQSTTPTASAARRSALRRTRAPIAPTLRSMIVSRATNGLSYVLQQIRAGRVPEFPRGGLLMLVYCLHHHSFVKRSGDIISPYGVQQPRDSLRRRFIESHACAVA